MLSPAYSAAAVGTSPCCRWPCFGWRSTVTTIVAPLVLLGLSFLSDFQTSASDFQSALVIGLVYGLAGAWSWTLSLMEGKISRFLVGLAIVTLLSIFAATTFHRPLLRYWANMAGMILVQSVLFWLVRMPSWRTSGSVDPKSHRQFQIMDILLVTTGLAVLLTVARRYQTPMASIEYWPVMVGVWIWLPVVASTVCYSMMDQGWTSRVSWMVASVALVLGGAFALAVLDQRLGDHDFSRVAALYGVIALTYAVTWWTFGWAARQDAIMESGVRQETAPAGE